MAWLLHSKMFKEKLKKWIMMYVAVMCFLGSVITYSRYISGMQGGSDEGFTASFNIKITPDNQCGTKQIETVDNLGNTIQTTVDNCSLVTRPTKELEYTFNVDYNELDVTTEVIIRMAFSEYIVNYKNVKLYEIINNQEIELFTLDFNSTEITRINGYKIVRGNNSILLTDVFDVSTAHRPVAVKKFRIKMEADINQVGSQQNGQYVYNEAKNYDQLLLIGFTATQQK